MGNGRVSLAHLCGTAYCARARAAGYSGLGIWRSRVGELLHVGYYSVWHGDKKDAGCETVRGMRPSTVENDVHDGERE